MYDLLALITILVAATVLPMALLVPIAMSEKRSVWPYLAVEDSASAQPVSIEFDAAKVTWDKLINWLESQ